MGGIVVLWVSKIDLDCKFNNVDRKSVIFKLLKCWSVLYDAFLSPFLSNLVKKDDILVKWGFVWVGIGFMVG